MTSKNRKTTLKGTFFICMFYAKALLNKFRVRTIKTGDEGPGTIRKIIRTRTFLSGLLFKNCESGRYATPKNNNVAPNYP